MRDATALAVLCERLAGEAGLSVVGRQFHAFVPHGDAGVTGMLLLAESHLAVHTWPELRAVTLDVFVCTSPATTRTRRTSWSTRWCRVRTSRVRRQQLSRGA